MVAFVLKDLELGNKPYEQNMPESINDMMKDWTKFLPQDMDRFIISLYDLVQSFDQEEELAWFQLSDKWEVCHQFQQHLPTESHAEINPGERKASLKKVSKTSPDPEAYKKGASILRSHHCLFPQLHLLRGSQRAISATFQR